MAAIRARLARVSIQLINDDDAAAAVDRECLSSDLSNEDWLLGDDGVVLVLLMLPFIYGSQERIETMITTTRYGRWAINIYNKEWA